MSAALDQVGHVGRGFAGTTAAICCLLMGADLLLISGAADVGALLHRNLDPGTIATFVHFAVVFTVMLAIDALFAAVGTEVARRVVALATIVVGLVTVVAAAVAIGPALGGTAPAALEFLPAALLGGGALAGMLLGHWYLVAPALSFRPLRISIYTVFAAVALDSLAIALALTTAAPATRARVLSGDQAPLFWLLVVGAGVFFTAAVSALTLHFARIRANQPAMTTLMMST